MTVDEPVEREPSQAREPTRREPTRREPVQASGPPSRWKVVRGHIRDAFVENAAMKFVAFVLALSIGAIHECGHHEARFFGGPRPGQATPLRSVPAGWRA